MAAANPGICEFVDLTDRYQQPATHEGRHIVALRISDNVGQIEDEVALRIAFVVEETLELRHVGADIAGG